jgi:hypothetical protein
MRASDKLSQGGDKKDRRHHAELQRDLLFRLPPLLGSEAPVPARTIAERRSYGVVLVSILSFRAVRFRPVCDSEMGPLVGRRHRNDSSCDNPP